MSEDKYCIGCGIKLQDENMTAEGYTTSIENDICSRCFKMKNYGDYQVVTKSNDEYINILKSVNDTKDLVVYIIDLLNISRDINLIREYFDNKVLLVLNKRDILPKSIKDEKIKEYFAKLGLDYEDVIIVSPKKNYNIDELLLKIIPNKKLMYDAKYAEKLYLDYQSIKCDDGNTIELLKNKFVGQDILLIGPGKNIKKQRGIVKDYIKKHNPIVIAVNYAPEDFDIDYVFLTKAKRYTQLIKDINKGINAKVEIIATSNVTKTSGDFDYVLNYSSLIDKNTEIIDNSLVMLLKAMCIFEVKNISLAGFDGYSKLEDNYYDISREYSFVKEKSEYFNKYVRDYLTSINKKLKVRFITDSYYCH